MDSDLQFMFAFVILPEVTFKKDEVSYSNVSFFITSILMEDCLAIHFKCTHKQINFTSSL